MPERDDPMAIAEDLPKRAESWISGDPRFDFLDDLVRYAYARLGSLEDAEDVAIEALQAGTQVRGGLRSLREPKLYLLGIARRKVADHLRRRGKRPLSLDSHQEMAASPSFDLEEQAAVREVLGKLPEAYQDALILKYVHGLSAEEIAAVLRKTHASTRSLIQRAREVFKRECGEDQGA